MATTNLTREQLDQYAGVLAFQIEGAVAGLDALLAAHPGRCAAAAREIVAWHLATTMQKIHEALDTGSRPREYSEAMSRSRSLQEGMRDVSAILVADRNYCVLETEGADLGRAHDLAALIKRLAKKLGRKIDLLADPPRMAA